MTSDVCVLLSTFNGERFLAEQLDSILRQNHPPDCILARDDGSSDRTVAILEDYAAGEGRISVHRGENLGPVASFEALLSNAPDSGYYAFCDQDDVWLPDKLANAMEMLSAMDQQSPLLYCCRLDYVSANLISIGLSPPPRRLDFGNALVENVATGCTIVLNHAARQVLLSRPWDGAMMHDSWAYLVICGAGQALYDERPGVLYRQHGANAVGGAPGMAAQLLRRAVRFAGRRDKPVRYRDQAERYRLAFGKSLCGERRRMLDRFVESNRDLRTRLAYAATMDVWRQTALDTLILRALIAAGQY